MSLSGTLNGWFNRESKKYMYAPIDLDHVKGATFSSEPLEGGKNYFRLWLSEMCLAKDLEWFKSWHPVVHSIINFQFGDQKVSLPYIAGSLNLEGVNSSNLDKVIQLNHPMTTLMPFNGGVIEITAGILAVEGRDYLSQFIKVMGDFANILVMPQLSAALNVIGPIAKGVEELLGVSNGKLHLGLHQSFVGKEGGGANNLKAGYIAAILAEERDLDAKKLWIVNDRLRYGMNADSSEPLVGLTYMLFRVENREQRDDMDGLTAIRGPFNDAISSLLKGEKESAKTQLATAIIAAMTSPDLTKADRRRVAKALKDEYEETQEMTALTRVAVKDSGKGVLPGGLSYLNKAMKRAMPVEEALALGEPTFEEIFGKS